MIYTGAYDVAATDRHNDVVYWAFHETLHQSVERRASEVPPMELTEEQAAAGFPSFDAMCATCHGAPGARPAEWAEGLRPNPPPLSEAVGHWSAAELFWLLKHGIKMSGMPAFGPTHEDAELWEIVAFVERLPNLSPEDYAALKQELGGGHHGSSGGGAEAGARSGGQGAHGAADAPESAGGAE